MTVSGTMFRPDCRFSRNFRFIRSPAPAHLAPARVGASSEFVAQRHAIGARRQVGDADDAAGGDRKGAAFAQRVVDILDPQ